MTSYNIKEKINLHYIHTTKFKTNLIGINFHIPLDENITKASLISSLMPRGIEDVLPTPKLNDKLLELYGSNASTEICKKGDGAILSILFDYVNPKFVDDKNILKGILEVINLLTFHYKVGENYLSQEKENLKQRILSIINDKHTYSSERLIEEMCIDEPYSLNELGDIKHIDNINTSNLQEYYNTVLLKSPIDIFISGDCDINNIVSEFTQILVDITPDGEYAESFIRTTVAEVKYVEEKQKISQGKLNLGFRTKMSPTDKDFCALVVASTIFGGGVSSKLFNNVREKLSLCYYVYSRINRLKGIMTVASGIEVNTFDKAKNEILKQLDDVKNGNITEDEFNNAKISLANGLKSVEDSNVLMQDYFLTNLIIGNDQSIEEYSNGIQKVTLDEVVRVAQNITLDTVYFLTAEA